MTTSRLPRFRRASAIAPFQLTERDRDIIRQVYRHRFLRSSHICPLVGGSSQQVLRRLKLLYHHGFLTRPRAQIEFYQYGTRREMVYGLGNKGTALLKAELGHMFREVPWDEENGSVKRVFLEHALLVSDVMVSIALACRQNGIRLLTEQDLATENRPFKWTATLSRQKFSMAPDRVFAFETNGGDGNARRSYFFLEADRGTMPVVRKTLQQTSFYRKLLAYEATWLDSIHQKRFGFHRFRVITVTTNAMRVNSMVGACAKLNRGHGLFLFADIGILGKPSDILAAEWKTGRGEISHLLD